LGLDRDQILGGDDTANVPRESAALNKADALERGDEGSK
jgi:hypothetical protein